jgi:hypothetical protein
MENLSSSACNISWNNNGQHNKGPAALLNISANCSSEFLPFHYLVHEIATNHTIKNTWKGGNTSIFEVIYAESGYDGVEWTRRVNLDWLGFPSIPLPMAIPVPRIKLVPKIFIFQQQKQR